MAFTGLDDELAAFVEQARASALLTLVTGLAELRKSQTLSDRGHAATSLRIAAARYIAVAACRRMVLKLGRHSHSARRLQRAPRQKQQRQILQQLRRC